MMHWYYIEGGEKHGPIGDLKLNELIANETILPETLLWRAGMPKWLPLRKVNRAEEISANGYLEPPGFSRENAFVAPTNLQGHQQIAEFRVGPAWENRAKIGFFSALFNTIRGVLSEPGDMFSRMNRKGGFGAPMLYFTMLATLSTWADIGYQIALFNMAAHPMTTNPAAHAAHQKLLPLIQKFLAENWLPACIAAPFFSVLALSVLSVIYHLLLKVFGAEYSFQTTFRTVAYALGSASILKFIPTRGVLIYAIGGVLVLVIGFTKMQRISVKRSILATLLPLLLGLGGFSFYWLSVNAPPPAASAEKTPAPANHQLEKDGG